MADDYSPLRQISGFLGALSDDANKRRKEKRARRGMTRMNPLFESSGPRATGSFRSSGHSVPWGRGGTKKDKRFKRRIGHAPSDWIGDLVLKEGVNPLQHFSPSGVPGAQPGTYLHQGPGRGVPRGHKFNEEMEQLLDSIGFNRNFGFDARNL